MLSKLDYCNCLFYGMSNDNFHKLQLIQNHAARLVKRVHKRSSASCLLKELHWLPIKYRVMYKVSLIVFKCLNTSEFPSYLKDLIFTKVLQYQLQPSGHFCFLQQISGAGQKSDRTCKLTGQPARFKRTPHHT